MNWFVIRTFFSVALALFARAVLAITIPTVPVGNPGNPADTRFPGSQPGGDPGSVAYNFHIGKTEVTNAQYAEFLNGVAATDTYGLYSTSMGSETWGGIVRNGVSGSYTYSVKADAVGQGPGGTDYAYANKPVVFVSAADAFRFANWLHHGQPTGPQNASTTEDGAYTLTGIGGSDFEINIALHAVTRNPGARWFLPNLDEWYKAAYHNNDGLTANYWTFPTGSDIEPNNNPPSLDTGDSANFYSDDFMTGNYDYPMTDAGAYAQSYSPYGTFDQGGNVMEWNEPRFNEFRPSQSSWLSHVDFLASWDDGGVHSPMNESSALGFRVASIPEPSTALLAGFAIVSGLLYRHRAAHNFELSGSSVPRQRRTIR